MADIVRQGDVILTRIARPRAFRPKRTSLVLARGEATGHAHRIRGGVVVEFPGARETPGPVVASTGRTVLEHEEHQHIRIPRGLWRVSMQREWTPQSTRRVVD